MIRFSNSGDKVILTYTPELGENWIEKELNRKGKVILKKTFTFFKEDFIEPDKSDLNEEEADIFDEYDPSNFEFAVLEGDYYKIKKGVLTDKINIHIQKDIGFTADFFVADSNVSVFKIIEGITAEDVYIGGTGENVIPLSEFETILKQFPNSYERKKYVAARVSSVLRNYLDEVKDSVTVYQNYLNKKLSQKVSNLKKVFQEADLFKYQTILDRLKDMLEKEDEYTEHHWQQEILQVILLLYPKYIFAFTEVPVKANLSGALKEKFLDFLLVDSNGNIDILEIKKPFDHAIMTKGFHRGNYIPLKELTGTVMQIEKYIYFLNRWSVEGEKYLTEKYRKELPEDFTIKITNPNGIILMGRENNLSGEQKADFEVVKRKYTNVMDIITYDNLLERLQFTIEQIKKT